MDPETTAASLCPEGTICNERNAVCVDTCTSDDECADRGDGYVCDGFCVYRECNNNDDCAYRGEGYVCDMSDSTYYSCFEGCASPNGIYGDGVDCYTSGNGGSFYSCNATTGRCDNFYCNNSTDCEGITDTLDLVCQWGHCVESCIGQDETYCYALTEDSGVTCQDSGVCDYFTCYNGEECPDGTACDGYYCNPACATDSECQDQYNNENYKCDADWSVCVYSECSVDDDCAYRGDGYVCDGSSCSESCETTGCDWGDDYDCTDACQDDGICGECTYLGCNAPGNSCDDYGFRTECQEDGECDYPDDDCADDNDCDGDQVCQYLPNFDEPASGEERRFCGDSCVGQEDIIEYGETYTYCNATYGYENCDADTGTCYNCRSDADCTNADRPTCYLGTGLNVCYRTCEDDSDCEGDELCLFENDAQVYYCGNEDDSMRPTMEPTVSPTVEEDPVNNSGAVQQRVVMAAVAVASLAWWM